MLAGIAVVICAGVFALATYTEQKQTAVASAPMVSARPAPVFVPPSGPAPGTPPDLSKMTMRDAADRLFNRIMRVSEQGNIEEAQRFVPMAVQAYNSLPVLDDDAHYHLGLIYGIAGDDEQGRLQIAALTMLLIHYPLLRLPTHELGMLFLVILLAVAVAARYLYGLLPR